MQTVTVTGRDGHISQMEFAYLRGSKIRYFILPDMLKNAPFFRKNKDNQPVGRGKTAILRAQGMNDAICTLFCVVFGRWHGSFSVSNLSSS